MQWSVRINEAYQRLKDPLRRAAYLCELHGAPIQAEEQHRHAGRVSDAADGVARSAGRRPGDQ
jgi:curved DNA-binding protein CbpA